MKRQLARTVYGLFSVFVFLIAGHAQTTPVYKPDVIVSQDGSGDFTTIQEAVNSVRDISDKGVTIHIRDGVYHEKLVIPSWKTNIVLLGESREHTIITNADYSGKPVPGGKDVYGKNQFTTYTSYTVLVQGTDIQIRNLTIRNTAGRVGQAVALHVEGDRFSMINCMVLGNQDTLYTAREGSRQYYRDCYIEGTTDFLFGEAIAVFENCTIKSMINSYVTAAATRKGQAFGYVLIGCRLVADTSVKKVFLGRPWRPYAKTVFIRCELGPQIVPQGWDPWKGDLMFPDKEKTAFYAEYANTGAGSQTKNRVAWSKQLSSADAKKYRIKNIFNGWQPVDKKQ
jgi:pectinesterase